MRTYNFPKQVERSMRFMWARQFWLAMKIAALRRGKPFDTPEPKLEDFT